MVKKSIPIYDVIRSYGYEPRQNTDDRMGMRCPFHNERTASFTIYLGNNSFYCFGCGAGGSVIEFIALQENRPMQSVIDQFKSSIDVTSNKFAIGIIVKEMERNSVDGNKYRNDMHFELRTYLRDMLKKHPEKTPLVDECFKEMRMFFYNPENSNEKIVKQFSDYILEKATS
jgi:DNA primase